MVETLRIFSDEVTRVAREVGTEGKLGGQARVAAVDGTWRSLRDSVNTMALNLTNQVRAIAYVTVRGRCYFGAMSLRRDTDCRRERRSYQKGRNHGLRGNSRARWYHELDGGQSLSAFEIHL